MATYVTVHRPARRREESEGQGQPAGFHHDMAGKVIGFSVYKVEPSGFPRERVLVALEDGTLATFAPSELRAGKVVYNTGGQGQPERPE